MFSDSFRWPHEAILLLLRIYRQHEDKIISRKMSMKKFWMMVASKLVAKNYNVTSSQCKSKMAGLKNTYRNVRDYNSKYGNNGRTWPYFDTMDELFRDKPWAIPSPTLDNNNPTSSSYHENSIDKKRNGSSPSKPESPSKQLRDCILLDKVLAIAKESITKRRKMHEEAMARQDKLLDILEKLMKK
ncbi:hypothetical protein DMN91_011368 [Ooceraea biroi]|uniref:Myb/SANT-like DNA-binding domain-containing protein n=1 Tax=Ooceraea biroi TaxID=2015173 RepID=A0A3L8D583_OOCBI|nr:hypothetical protein DMN91_011368 [Ooceraea biroi]